MTDVRCLFVFYMRVCVVFLVCQLNAVCEGKIFAVTKVSIFPSAVVVCKHSTASKESSPERP